jgi:hypothetical protein
MARIPWFSAKTDPAERDRRGWLEDHGITPMNRSSRLWDMEIVPPPWMPHTTERVGSLDRARRALQDLRAGVPMSPIKWQGSQSMATGRAYDWCYCVEAARPEDDTIDGRTACPCQCPDCKPKKKGDEAVHWRKRHWNNQLHGQSRATYWNEYYHEHHWWIKLLRWWEHRTAPDDNANWGVPLYSVPDPDDEPTIPLDEEDTSI